MKSIFLSSSLLVILTCSTIVFAEAGTSSGGGTGPNGVYEQCSGQLLDGTNVVFEVRATAAISIVDSILFTDSNQLVAHLYCEKGGLVAPNAPSAGKVEWNCGQTDFDHSIDGGIIVTVMQAGVTGITTAQVSAKQMYPLPPQELGTLICK